MSKKLSIDDKVECRLFNSSDKKFYGKFFTATIIQIWGDSVKRYRVESTHLAFPIWLHRKEIIRRLKE